MKDCVANSHESEADSEFLLKPFFFLLEKLPSKDFKRRYNYSKRARPYIMNFIIEYKLVKEYCIKSSNLEKGEPPTPLPHKTK